ncbi:metallophosphoesterase family protein [Halorubrum ezzemoulense]|jgi:serine/threonine protein phosphatase 1|uniref:Serine/threonine protein phosphatase n=1 Tax=Halorubrum ezzemoulense TaxID=337243 RepID=A0A256K238_HALEZ|nr:metallophosphoesterase family protein [Halorubrum ezzemoulense]MDB2223251.1 metallophosphoesterase family protein [Halorubrum ezzemoulense]MDB2237783.1 metallophosphoesterase family protein [Halorubrum ezzemoulense]MDB2248723.1 metallophosphoesterase family protein [Halorubrum ezzemoulense]MDB2265275.1 metallophosphoesterase family protein [Halorubrum ezzemoulense]OYR75228.1 serine/threonine protein phosphatase [Halorubrum ezzemoulense]
MGRFHPDVEPHHLDIDLDEYDRAYVVGDVHGCPEPLDRLLSRLEVTDDDLVAFVGDLVRKGPDSASVVERVRNADNMFSVRGNNEEKLLRGEKSLASLSGDDLAWIESLPVAITVGENLIVHGGVDPRKPLAEHTIDDLQNTRSLAPGGSYDPPYWYEEYAGPPRVFFGHTVLDEPVRSEWAVGLDTGCVYGGALTAYDLRAETVTAVPALRDGVGRSDAKIVDVAELS